MCLTTSAAAVVKQQPLLTANRVNRSASAIPGGPTVLRILSDGSLFKLVDTHVETRWPISVAVFGASDGIGPYSYGSHNLNRPVDGTSPT